MQAVSKLFAKPIPVLGVTGEFESGKTRFLLSIAPGPATCIFDTEASSETYEEIGCKRIDVPAGVSATFPQGYKPIDVFTWWWGAVKSIPPGRFRVIALDVAEDIESGLADWVWENPLYFNHNRNQYLKMSGIYWGDVKALWKTILLDITSRCETFAFAVHTGSVWGADNKPLRGITRPKGKSTLMELATLFLHMERPVQMDGSKQEVPSARVLKTRLSHNRVDETSGELITKAILPPRLPIATVQAIRQYIAKPADFSSLAAGERAVPTQMSSDERAAIALATEQARAEAESAKLQRVIEARKAGVSIESTEGTEPVQVTEADQTEPIESLTQSVAAPPADPTPSAATTQPTHTAKVSTDESGGTEAQPETKSHQETPRKRPWPTEPKAQVSLLWEEFCHFNKIPTEQKFELWNTQILKKFGVTHAKELTEEAVGMIVEMLKQKLRPLYEAAGVPEGCPF